VSILPKAVTDGVLTKNLATATGIVSEVVASQPPTRLVVDHARHSMVISEKDLALQQPTETPTEDYAVAHDGNTAVDWDHEKYPPPTDEEKATLRKVPGNIPWIGYSLCVVEFAERASYYGATTVFANFLQRPLPPGKQLY
jgi:hypothetical protein